ncbi:MAG TPA: HAD family hydrolase [Nitrospirae bacterium]|nr:HAD family hydrolase [Nitrospirota bacterium]HDL20226.1 HAD family hydrolase [Nitrospirota bacterium]HDZ01162.1 HAD family hydrolase [Nitrospirota bacterium]
MKQNGKKLVLFDIDGTLISAGGAGTRSMNLAFNALFGIKDAFRDISMAGKTDPQIMREGLKLHGFDSMAGSLEKMKEMYLQFIRNEINNPHRQLKPGIKEALGFFSQAGMTLGLLTGNLEKGAKIKLSPFGIYDYFLDGAFGSDDEDRDKLLPIAIDKFRKKGFEFLPADCIVIGDTPRDVKCAKIHGAYSIAVATGPYPKEDLLNTEADIILDSLAETGEYMNFIML